ncbi:hypothetical protein D0T49_11140 [Paludibacter sp. 221]|uniref:AbiH family protein n=1 Tax=Paludibacter sp. 221 TaxID=2302939 RepID=UPI0013D45C4D|nr:AbiH family protein [Paludibacter sp. 221]NDV47602.1 hypothetical protein [Paludibacter sp. 221]
MNRIVLVGNGFDLSYGLETSYKHFIGKYWKDQIRYFSDNKYVDSLNELIKLPKENLEKYSRTTLSPFYEMYSFKEFKEAILYRLNLNMIEFQNKFLEKISDKNLEKWVDIEEEYYLQIKEIIQFQYPEQREGVRDFFLKTLNIDFEKIKIELEKYLINEQNRRKIEQFNFMNIEEDFNLVDFTTNGLEYFFKKYFSETEEYRRKFEEKLSYLKNKNINKILCKTYIYPENTLFLNFNYTNLAERFISCIYSNRWQLEDWAKSKFTINYIHGELNKPDNPMIFGYGDEDDELHREIERKGGDYLNNIKTINYLKNDNYKRLLRFIESDLYQVFIFGHSCGLSDKTLLKTMFEHENCVSIKPFFYVDKKEHSNYDDIIKNIYRIFSDKVSMRDKVVNEKYCSQLVQCKS